MRKFVKIKEGKKSLIILIFILNMTLTDFLLSMLTDYATSYRTLRKSIFTMANGRRGGVKVGTIKVLLSRLKKRGLIENPKKGFWQISELGQKYLESKKNLKLLTSFSSGSIAQGKKDGQEVIVVFDIPEKYKKKRDWLRRELISFGLKPIQKSVLIGKTRFPSSFVDDLEELDLLPYVHIFVIKERLF